MEPVVDRLDGVCVKLFGEERVRVLLVDDDADFLPTARQCLEDCGNFHVDTAGSAEEALEKLREREFDVVVTDYQMPGKNGLELLREVRQEGSDIPFIVFTNKGKEEIAIEALNSGVEGYVGKQGEAEAVYQELKRSILAAVRRRRIEKRLKESENLLRQITENVQDMLLLTDENLTCTYASSSVKWIFGYEPSEVIGKPLYQFIHPDDLTKVMEVAKKVLEDHSAARIEIRCRRANGSYALLEGTGKILTDKNGQVNGIVITSRDITERKKAEEELARLSSAVKMSTDSIVISDLNGKIIDVNEATLKMYGTDDKRDLLEKNSFDLIAPEDREEALAGMEEVLAKGYFKSREYHIITKNGSRIPIEMSVAIMKGADGKPIGFVGISRDVTERRRMEEALRESEERFRQVADNAQEWIWEVDSNGLYTYASPIVEKIFGYKPEEIVGKKYFYDLFHPEDREELKKGAFQAFAEKSPFHEFLNRNVHKNGNIVWVSTSGVPIVDGKDALLGYRGADTDITEQERTEQILKESEEKYRKLFEEATDALFIADFETGIILDCNDAATKLVGREKSELVGMHQRFLHPEEENGSEFGEVFEQHRSDRQGQIVEDHIITKSGEVRNVTIKPSLIEVNGKKIVQGIFRDVTEQKRAEQALRESEEKYRRLFEEANDAIFVADYETGIIVDCNRAATELIGREKSELVGMHQHYLHPSEDTQGEFSRTFEQHRTDGEGSTIETHIVTKAGEIRDVAIRANLFEVNSKRMLRGLFRDVTERNKYTKRIQFQAELLNAVGQAIIATDTKGNITYWNHAAEQFYGWAEAEVLGHNIVDVTPAETSKENATKMLNRLIAGEGWSGEFLAKRRDGTIFPAIVTDAPIKNDRGELIGIVGVSTDITEQKWMQEVFNDAIGKVVELNEKLQVVESLTRHDIRNKLAALNGRVFLLKKRLSDNPGAFAHVKEMELLSQQILRLLEFERIYVQVGAEELSPVNVKSSVAEAASLFSNLMDVEVVNDCQGLVVLADPLLRQLFYNLIDNTLKYGEKVSKIRVRWEEQENQLKLVYEDNGIGISDDGRANLFQKGFGKGTGYGLHLIKRICEAYGWTIQETGKQGAGAQFTMTIPKFTKDGKEGYKTS